MVTGQICLAVNLIIPVRNIDGKRGDLSQVESRGIFACDLAFPVITRRAGTRKSMADIVLLWSRDHERLLTKWSPGNPD